MTIFELTFEDKTEGMYDIILVDGSHLFHRAIHAYTLGIQTETEYIPTGAVYGFLRMVQNMSKKYADSPCQIIFCWEGGYHHRIALHANYKGSRRKKLDLKDKTEDEKIAGQMFGNEFRSQKKLLEYFISISGWSHCKVSGYEADDAIASLCKRFDDGENRVAIYSGDGDLHQCVTKNVHVITPQVGRVDKIYTVKEVIEKWGVIPKRIPLVKALSGDTADDIPGCKGCGAKWAMKILDTYENLDAIFEHIEDGGILVGEYLGKKWTTKSITKNLHTSKELVYVSQKLAEVVDDLDCHVVKGSFDKSAVREFFEAYQFESFNLEDFARIGK